MRATAVAWCPVPPSGKRRAGATRLCRALQPPPAPGLVRSLPHRATSPCAELRCVAGTMALAQPPALAAAGCPLRARRALDRGQTPPPNGTDGTSAHRRHTQRRQCAATDRSLQSKFAHKGYTVALRRRRRARMRACAYARRMRASRAGRAFRSRRGPLGCEFFGRRTLIPASSLHSRPPPAPRIQGAGAAGGGAPRPRARRARGRPR